MRGPTLTAGLTQELTERKKTLANQLERGLDMFASPFMIQVENALYAAYQKGLQDGYAQGVHEQQELKLLRCIICGHEFPIPHGQDSPCPNCGSTCDPEKLSKPLTEEI